MGWREIKPGKESMRSNPTHHCVVGWFADADCRCALRLPDARASAHLLSKLKVLTSDLGFDIGESGAGGVSGSATDSGAGAAAAAAASAVGAGAAAAAGAGGAASPMPAAFSGVAGAVSAIESISTLYCFSLSSHGG